MSDRSAASTLGVMTLEEPGGPEADQAGASPRARGGGPPLRCGPCLAVWPRGQQQTWLCAVPLVMGFVGLGLSLMLLKWIVVGSVQDYVPTDLVDAKGIGAPGQDPIFLSKPSAMPKGLDTTTTTTTTTSTGTATPSTTTPLAADGTAPAPRTRFGPPSNRTTSGGSTGNGGNGGGAVVSTGNRAPHLHNQVGGNRVLAGTGPTTTHAPRSTTVRRGGGGGGGNAGSGRNNGPPNSRSGPTSSSSTASTAAATTSTTAKSTTKALLLPPTSPPSLPAKPTQRWIHVRPNKGPVTRPHHRSRTLAPTSPSPRSGLFKPCVDDKDLAFCLNEGECSIIETVAGVHRHCRCKEGYHGLRCDQFVPKSDSILSDPTDELGIEFMESRETYQRQVVSIFSIASGICLLGLACMALYRRNKKHREKLRSHLSDSHNLRDCSINASGLMSKSSPRPQSGLQLQQCCKPHGSSPPQGGSAASGPSTVAPPILNRALAKGKRFRSSSLSPSPAQRHKDAHHFRTPPISRGRQNLIRGTLVADHAYRHLQEVESTEMEAESLRGFDSCKEKSDVQQSGGTPNMQPSLSGRKVWKEVPCTRLDPGTTSSSPPSLRTRPVAIIPSLQGSDHEGGGQRGGGGRSSHAPSPPPPASETVLGTEEEARPGHPHTRPATRTTPARHTPPPRAPGVPSQAPGVEPGGVFRHTRLVTSAVATGRSPGTVAMTTVTELESTGEGTTAGYAPRALYVCPEAGGHREAVGLGEQHAPLVVVAENCGRSAVGSSSIGTGMACAKPSVS